MVRAVLGLLELVRMQPKHLNLGLEAAWLKAFTVRHLLWIHHWIHRAGCWLCWRAAADAPLARSCELPLAWKPLPCEGINLASAECFSTPTPNGRSALSGL